MKVLVAVAIAFSMSACAHARAPRMAPQATGSCRSDLARWYAPDDAKQRARLDSWCAGVGPVTISQGAATPAGRVPLGDIAFVSWNVHVGIGNLHQFIDDLRAGRLTSGRPPRHFVLLLQEILRTPGVPAYEPRAKGARRIRARHQDSDDIEALSRELGLSVVYAPSMRNGNGARDPATDRGNAILSTLPLAGPMAIELPIERQRRVALFADVAVSAAGTLAVGVIHLDATDSARHLWVFHARRWRATQATALGTLLPEGTLVLGADLNTWMGRGEPASHYFRRIFGGTPHGGLDYLFFRGPESTTAHYDVVSNTYGSDHHPLIGWFNN
jgi:endonuclease/exonuclease/phosphatase family metal-dependent hydrolase